MGTYLTYEELTGREMTEPDLVGRLCALSAEDCLASIADIGARMAAAEEPYFDPGVQRHLISHVAGDGALGSALTAALTRDAPTIVFSQQQLLHLARLVVLHADKRLHDDFEGGALYSEWVTCLLGVCDLLDADLQVEDRDQRLSWELRQCGLNHHEDQLPVIAVHHEIYRELWPRVDPTKAAEIEDAFVRHTGMRLGDYFAVGAAVQARFATYGEDPGGLAIRPAEYFSTVTITEKEWGPFFDLVARDLKSLTAELVAEDAQYGATTYGSLTFERYPLFEVEEGLYLPISMVSLQRRVSEGVFHILAEAAVKDQRDRRHYISPFGDLFQEIVEAALRRGAEASGTSIPVAADVPYGPKNARRRSSDVILGYEGHPVFVEVVSGPLQAATTTRGDLNSFTADLQRLVLGKARQLDTSIRDFFQGTLLLDDIDPCSTRRVSPVIVMSHAFPHASTISDEIVGRLRQAGLLRTDRIEPPRPRLR